MACAQRPAGLNSETEGNFGLFPAELAGSAGTVGWNPVWVWVGEEPGSGWAQPLGNSLQSPQNFTGEIFQGFTQKHSAGNFGVWRSENKPSSSG